MIAGIPLTILGLATNSFMVDMLLATQPNPTPELLVSIYEFLENIRPVLKAPSTSFLCLGIIFIVVGIHLDGSDSKRRRKHNNEIIRSINDLEGDVIDAKITFEKEEVVTVEVKIEKRGE